MATKVQLHAKCYWKLVFEYDNSQNEGTITQSYNSKTYTQSTRSSFSETVSRTTIDTSQKWSVSAEVGASYGPVSASVSSSFESSKEVNDMLEKTIRTSGENTVKTETEYLREYKVGPRSRLNLYQQCFEGPGMSAAFDVYSTDSARANQIQDILIDVFVKSIDFIESLKVVYTDTAADAPNDRIRELHGGNPDINAGFKGKFVWVVPNYTHDSSKAATAFDFVNQPDGNSRYSDLAKGAGGDFRYLIPVYNTRERSKVTECAILRTPTATGIEEIKKWGWMGLSGDMNKGRKGDFLYLLWKTRYAY